MKRKINFNAGPAEMPAEVLHELSKGVKKYGDSGLSVLELPHRGKEFMDILEESKALVRELCALNDSYEVLWLQGGGRLQFCMVPMNFLGEGTTAGYIDSGHWADEAITYARYYGNVEVLASSKATKYSRLPDWPQEVSKDLKYLHLTTNNTIYGTQWHTVPGCKVQLIADMSSDILSCKRDYNQYSLFYAAAQKNLGAAGVALVVIKKDLLKKVVRPVPPMLSYAAQVKEKSVLNTANVFGVYASLLMLRWTKEKGIAAIEAENERKAALLYSALDASTIFKPHVRVAAHRSKMNVCFTAINDEVESKFLERCKANDIAGIKGHRSVGGFRASMYNALPYESVAFLVKLIEEFELEILKQNRGG